MGELTSEKLDELISLYEKNRHTFKKFMIGVVATFEEEPELNTSHSPLIYTVKRRLKDSEHLRDKINRKWADGVVLTNENLFDVVNDLAGVRVLHMYQDQFEKIHSLIMNQEWHLKEPPIAYSWDPETSDYFKSLGLVSKIKPSYYTSIHYVVQPKKDSDICCEIQVRTLFEEIWGEIDHTINYPHPSENNSCKEQLRVLSKLVSTGTRLADSIFRTHNEQIFKK